MYACLLLAPQVTQHIATCQPFSSALDNGRVVLCDMMADPWVSDLGSDDTSPPHAESEVEAAGTGQTGEGTLSGQVC